MTLGRVGVSTLSGRVAAEGYRDCALARIELIAAGRIARHIVQQQGVVQAEADDGRVVAGDVIELRAARVEGLDLEGFAGNGTAVVKVNGANVKVFVARRNRPRGLAGRSAGRW